MEKITKQTSLLFDLTKESVNYRRGKMFRECSQCLYKFTDEKECKRLNQRIEYNMCCDMFIRKM